MGDMKEQILLAALRLFACEGYEAVSVSDIAGELGVTKGALYRHYRNKRDIFDSILRRMEHRDMEQAEQYEVPAGTKAEMEDAYSQTSLEAVKAFSKAMFRYWTEDEFASRFRRMLTLEQFRSREMAQLFQQYLASGPVDYLTDLFGSLGLQEPRKAAAEYYGPMFLLYSVYDATEDKRAVLDTADKCLENIVKGDH